MARKARNILTEELVYEESEQEPKHYTAIYARKSLDDKESLDIQIRMLREYVDESEDLILYQVFSDNGFSGVNFERPAFLRMIEEMKLGKFKTIVVKDGSRLGRNYLEAGAYMENIFPQYDIRFISVNDRYDSSRAECRQDGISLPLKNIMNEQYSKDLSRKLSPAFRIRQMEGKFIGGFTTYGYLKDKKDRNKLVVDMDAAPIVHRIFQSKAEGMSDGAIARELNVEGILSPFAYRYAKGLVKAEKYRDMPWKRGTISQIISNPIYLGNMVQGRTRQSLSMHEEKHRTPENEWIVVEGTHEAIINQQLFDTAKHILSERKKKYHKNPEPQQKPVENLLRGKVFCGDCGRAMELTKSVSAVATNRYYRCKLYNETAGQRCSLKSVRKEELEKIVLEMIQYHMKWYCNVSEVIKELNRTEPEKKKLTECKEKIETLTAEWHRNITLANGLNEDYQQQLLDESEYTFLKLEYDRKIKALDRQIKQLKEYTDTFKADFTGSKVLDRKIKTFQSFQPQSLNKEMVEAFISRVEISDAKHITIKLNCRDELLNVSQIARERGVEGIDGIK